MTDSNHVNEFRYLARHPLYHPIVAIVAVLVTATLMGWWSGGEQIGRPVVASTQGSLAASHAEPSLRLAVSAVVTRIVLPAIDAPDGTPARLILRRPDASRIVVHVTEHTEIAVPYHQQYVDGAVTDLLPGQRVSVTMERGSTRVHGGRVGSLVVDAGELHRFTTA